MAKKSNGEGSIFKRADGRWSAAVSVGYNLNGTVKRKYIYGKTKKEVHDKLVSLQNEININDGYISDENITLSQWGSTYLFQYLKLSVRPSTFERYESDYRVHIRDSSLGRMKVKDVKAFHIQTFLNEKANMSKSSIKKIYQLINTLFEKALLNDLIRKNPMQGVNIPKSSKQVKETKSLTREEQKKFIEALESEGLRVLFLTTLFTGLREGEIIALRWENVNLKEGSITVSENYKHSKVFDNNGEYSYQTIKQEPKTKAGNRNIPIPAFLIAELKTHKQKQMEHGLKIAGSSFNPNNLVFCSQVGTLLSARNLIRTHERICENANIQDATFHSLRHTFATRMIEEGVDIKTVQAWLGHSTIELTYNIYVHVQKEAKQAAAKVQDELFSTLTK